MPRICQPLLKALSKALNLGDPRGSSPHAKAARAIIAEKFQQPKAVEKILGKTRDGKQGSIWTLDVEKLKEAGVLGRLD